MSRASADCNLRKELLPGEVGGVSLSLNQIAGRVWGAGLVGSGLQFFTRLAAVFAEEVGGFGVFEIDGPI